MQRRLHHLLQRLRRRPAKPAFAQWYARATWATQRLAATAGWQTLAAVALLVLAAAVYALVLTPARQELAEQQRLYTERRQRPLVPPTIDLQRPGARQQLDAYYAFFPAADTVADDLGTLHRLAKEAGLDIEQADYRYAKETVGLLAHQEVSFALHGDYQRIRRFLHATLAALPHGACDQVSFQRTKASDVAVEARLHLVLYYRIAS